MKKRPKFYNLFVNKGNKLYFYRNKCIYMKLNRERDLKLVAVYAIINLKNGKMYIGVTTNLYKRIVTHIHKLRVNHKDCNINLLNDWNNFNEIDFEHVILEIINNTLDKTLLQNKEKEWVDKYDSNIIYNLRSDYNGICKMSNETKIRISLGQKQSYINNPSRIIIHSKITSEYWKNNPDKKEDMSKKLSIIKLKYKIQQFDKNNIFIKEYNSVEQVIKENPTYKWQNIYSVCNGYKPSIYGYIWYKIKI